MKYLLPMISSVPTIVLFAILVYNQVTGTYALAGLSREWTTAIILLPVLAFAASAAMIFVKKNAMEWRIAVVVNALPLLLVLLAGLLGLGR